MRKAKVFVINGLILTITTLIMRSISLYFNLYVSNKVGSEAIGVFSLVMSVYMFAITIASSGIGLAATRIVTEELTQNNIIGAKKAINLCLKYSLIIAIFTSFLLIINSKYIAIKWLNNTVSNTPLYYIALGLPFIAMSSVLNGYFTARRKAIKIASAQIFEFLVKFIATIYLLKINSSKGVEFICIALILADCISEIFSFLYSFMLYYFDKHKFLNTRTANLHYTKTIFKIAFPVATTSYIRSGLSTLKQLIIPVKLQSAGLSSAQALSSYGIINGMVMPIISFPSIFITSFSNLLVPEFSEYYVRKSFSIINNIIGRIFKITIVFSICIAIACIGFSNELSIAIYRDSECSEFIKILSPLICFIYLDNIIDNILKGLDKQFAVMCCNILDLFTSICFICVLLPKFGTMGYVATIFISEILNFSISLLILIKTTKFKFDFKNWIFKPLCFCIFSYLVVYFLNFSFSNFVFDLFLHIAIFVFIYFSILFSNKIISRQDFGI